MNFGQVVTAMVTPFDTQGNVDFPATKKLVNYLINNGSDALVISGTTGESPTLSTEEKIELFHHVVEIVDGRIPVIAGTGSYNTHASVQLTRQAEQAGVDAVMLVTPYYNKPSQEGMYQHFTTIASSTSLPVMIYNIPGRSVVDLSVETIVRLSQVDNIVSIKEASGDLDKMAEIITETDANFSVYTGEDSLSLPTVAIGGHGVVSVASHVLGNEMQDMLKSHKIGHTQYAATIHRQLLPAMKALFMAPSPSPVKEALEMYGVSVGSVRLPLLPLNEEEKQALQNVLQPKMKHVAS